MDQRRSAAGGDQPDFARQIEVALERIRPALQADGGDIELVAVVGRDAHVRLMGACSGCASAQFTLQEGVQRFLRREVPGFGEVISDPPEDGYGWRFDLMESA
jgi:Fe-S cluster biogenesis protein NfuA